MILGVEIELLKTGFKCKYSSLLFQELISNKAQIIVLVLYVVRLYEGDHL